VAHFNLVRHVSAARQIYCPRRHCALRPLSTRSSNEHSYQHSLSAHILSSHILHATMAPSTLLSIVTAGIVDTMNNLQEVRPASAMRLNNSQCKWVARWAGCIRLRRSAKASSRFVAPPARATSDAGCPALTQVPCAKQCTDWLIAATCCHVTPAGRGSPPEQGNVRPPEILVLDLHERQACPL
jgi:hypothetical protein